MSAETGATEPRRSDPLLSQAVRGLRGLRQAPPFGALVLAATTFLLAFFFGSKPDVDFGFRSPYVETRPSPTVAPPPSTTEPEQPTTTETIVKREDLEEVIVSAGFPDLRLVRDGSTITVNGTVPDEASRLAVLNRVFDVDGVTDVVDELVVEAELAASSAQIMLTRSSAAVTGLVADQGFVDGLVELLGESYRPDQINTDEMLVDEGVSPLDQVTVRGTMTDPVLATLIEERLRSISRLEFDVDIAVSDPPRLEVQLDELLTATPIRFDPGADAVTNDSTQVLDEVAALILSQFANAGIEVGGHTDSQGAAPDNAALSRRRAATVVAELRARGVENELVPVGYGSQRPRAWPEATATDRAANRRIEFRLL